MYRHKKWEGKYLEQIGEGEISLESVCNIDNTGKQLLGSPKTIKWDLLNIPVGNYIVFFEQHNEAP